MTMTRQHSGDVKRIVDAIDAFLVDGTGSNDDQDREGKITLAMKPADTLIVAKPFTSRRLVARLANTIVAFPLKALKKSILPYLNQNDRMISDIAYKLSSVQARLDDTPGIEELFEQKIYEIEKLNDRLKSELMAEINKDVSPLGATESTATKIINANTYKTLSKLNLGSGSFLKPGYVNVDHREIEGVDVVADIANLPYTVDSLDEIFLSHVAEHFTERRLIELLRYWFSLLKKDGKIVIIVPDIAAMTRQYVAGELSWQNLRQVILGGQDYNSDYHFNAFSVDYMEEVVNRALPDATYELKACARKNGECLELEVEIGKN